jgi:hypothetical protein
MIVECTTCRAYVEAKECGGFDYGRHEGVPPGRYAFLCCNKCRSPILVRMDNIGNMADGDIWDTPNRIYPTEGEQANPNAPKEIRTAFEEARACYRARSYTAAAIMCRKALEGVCGAHGVNERNLGGALRKMKEQGLIDERLFEWSDTLRVAGNEAAHGVGAATSEADARDILEFTNAILDYLFSYRDRFEKFKKRRTRNAAPENQPPTNRS